MAAEQGETDGDARALRLNLGCGKHPMEGWVNIDAEMMEGVDKVWDMDAKRAPFDHGTVDEFFGSHVIEHVPHPLWMMQELWRIAKPGTRATFACPYGSSDDAWENPTHVRPYFIASWYFFGQPHYWREDYGYRGDWAVDEIRLRLKPEIWHDRFKASADHFLAALPHERNLVAEQLVTLSAIKPARPPDREFQHDRDTAIILEVREPIDAWNADCREVAWLTRGHQQQEVGG